MQIFTDLYGQGGALITAWLEVRVPPFEAEMKL